MIDALKKIIKDLEIITKNFIDNINDKELIKENFKDINDNIINSIVLKYANFKVFLYSMLKKYYYNKYLLKNKFENNIVKNDYEKFEFLKKFEYEVVKKKFQSFVNYSKYQFEDIFSYRNNIYLSDPRDFLITNTDYIEINNDKLTSNVYTKEVSFYTLFYRDVILETPIIKLKTKEEVNLFFKSITKEGFRLYNFISKLKYEISFPSCGIIEVHGLNELFGYYNEAKEFTEYDLIFHHYDDNDMTVMKLIVNSEIDKYFTFSSLIHYLDYNVRSSMLLFSTNMNNKDRFGRISNYLDEYFGTDVILSKLKTHNKNSGNDITTWLYDYNKILDNFKTKING